MKCRTTSTLSDSALNREKVRIPVQLKGSASQLNKLVLKESPHIWKLIGTNLFQGLVINTYTNFQKTLPRAVSATTRGLQPLVVLATTHGN